MKLKLLKLAKPMIIPLWAIIDKLFVLHGLVGDCVLVLGPPIHVLVLHCLRPKQMLLLLDRLRGILRFLHMVRVLEV